MYSAGETGSGNSIPSQGQALFERMMQVMEIRLLYLQEEATLVEDGYQEDWAELQQRAVQTQPQGLNPGYASLFRDDLVTEEIWPRLARLLNQTIFTSAEVFRILERLGFTPDTDPVAEGRSDYLVIYCDQLFSAAEYSALQVTPEASAEIPLFLSYPGEIADPEAIRSVLVSLTSARLTEALREIEQEHLSMRNADMLRSVGVFLGAHNRMLGILAERDPRFRPTYPPSLSIMLRGALDVIRGYDNPELRSVREAAIASLARQFQQNTGYMVTIGNPSFGQLSAAQRSRWITLASTVYDAVADKMRAVGEVYNEPQLATEIIELALTRDSRNLLRLDREAIKREARSLMQREMETFVSLARDEIAVGSMARDIVPSEQIEQEIIYALDLIDDEERAQGRSGLSAIERERALAIISEGLGVQEVTRMQIADAVVAERGIDLFRWIEERERRLNIDGREIRPIQSDLEGRMRFTRSFVEFMQDASRRAAETGRRR
jgi:hypothetical protein